jgi:type VI secretion system protein ImpM
MSGIAVTPTPAPDLPGYFGKVPMRGDFVYRRLPRSFLDPWDTWLQEAIGTSRERMADGWLPAYLTAPVWRFVLSPGLCGPDLVAGLLMASMDSVGRHFPFTLAVTLPAGCADPAGLAAGGWFPAAEPVLLALRLESYDFAGFDAELAGLGRPACKAAAPVSRSEPCVNRPIPAIDWRLLDGLTVDELSTHPDLFCALLLDFWDCYSLWWCIGSETITPSLLVCRGLPPVRGFAALLDGDWERWGWHDIHAQCCGRPA